MRLVLVFAIASSCFCQSLALKQYIGLTDTQAAAIASLNSKYQSSLFTGQQRVNTLNQELATLYSKPAPDPNQLGIRYVELESIRRDEDALLSTLRAQVAAQLTPVQTTAVQALNAAAELQPLISEAQCGFLLDAAPPQWFDTPAFLNPSATFPYPGSSIPAAPSGSFCGSSVYPTAIRQYLNLTDAQIAALYNTSAAYNDYYSRKQHRITDLYVEIRDETAKPTLSAAALGVRYAELAAIDQDIQNQNNQLRQASRALLTPQQTVLLKTLQNDLALQSLIYEARSLNLLLPPQGFVGGTSLYTPSFASISIIPPFQISPLVQYLNLNDQQIAGLHKLNTDYQTYLTPQQSRINTINRELAGLYSTPSPDSSQLGTRYVELELIRRDIATHLTTLQSQDAAQLAKPQLANIQTLNSAAVLQPLIGDAQCGFLLDTAISSGFSFASFLLGYPVPTALMRSGDFSTVLGISYTYPYIPPAPTANFCGSTTFPISVREYLNLTDAEVSTIFTQSAAYNDYYTRKQNRIADVSVEIRDETSKPTPNALALGLRYSELEGIGQEITATGAQLHQAARAALTSQQAAQLKSLQDDANLQALVAEAQACNLLVLSPGTAQNPVFVFSTAAGQVFFPSCGF